MSEKTCGDCKNIQECNISNQNHPACNNLNLFETEIDKQLVFIEWLKSKGIYNVFERVDTMRKMYRVWNLMHDERPVII